MGIETIDDLENRTLLGMMGSAKTNERLEMKLRRSYRRSENEDVRSPECHEFGLSIRQINES